MTGGVPVVMARMHSNYNLVYVPYVVVRNSHLLRVIHGYSIAIFLTLPLSSLQILYFFHLPLLLFVLASISEQ